MEEIGDLAINSLENNIIIVSTSTLARLLQLGPDPLALYMFYCQTAKLQARQIGTYSNPIKATSTYCMENLHWTKSHFSRIKKILVEEKLVEDYIQKNDKGKILGYFIIIKYLGMQFDTLDSSLMHLGKSLKKPPTGEMTPPDSLIQNDTVRYNEVRVSKNHPLDFRDPYEIKEEKKEEKEKESNKEKEREEKKEETTFLQKKIFEDSVKSQETVTSTEKAFVQKNTTKKCSGRNPNICGSCAKCRLVPCTDLQIWELANEQDIWIDDVYDKHNQIVQLLDSGEFQKRYKNNKTVYGTLRNWLQMSVERGYIQRMSAVQKIAMTLEHPNRKNRIRQMLKIAEKKGIL